MSTPDSRSTPQTAGQAATPGQAMTPREALVALADRGQAPEAHIESLAVLLALVEHDEAAIAAAAPAGTAEVRCHWCGHRKGEHSAGIGDCHGTFTGPSQCKCNGFTPAREQPQAAPELAAAMAETRKLRELLDEATRWLRLNGRPRVLKIDAWRMKAGLPPLSHLDQP